MKYAIIASAFSGNKGAASMLEASIQTISGRDNEAEFTLFTVYPDQDARQNSYDNVSTLSAKPLFLGAVINSLALLYKILPPLRPLIRKQKHIKALVEADVLLDQGGITFVDGRAKFLIYNVATIWPAMLVGTPVVKCSQALGPFKSRVNRSVSKLFLPRVRTICARGDITYGHLKSLGLKNVIKASDYAFLLEVTKEEAKASDKLLENIINRPDKPELPVVGILPSEVVRKKSGQKYIKYQADFINGLLEEDYKVVLLAQSARENTEARHNNDLPLCRELAGHIKHDNFAFIDKELSAQALRHIISKLDFVVTSRFHAMVSALATTAPVLVIGWSHKYQEVLDTFGLKDLALDSSKLDQEDLNQAFKAMVDDAANIKSKIRTNLPSVKKSSAVNVIQIMNVVRQ